MEITLKLDIQPNDEVCDIEYEIIQAAARQMINEVMSNRYEHYGKTFREKLQEEVKLMLIGIMDTDFKEEVKTNLIGDLTKKYEKSKQYKEVKDKFSIETDKVIESGLGDIIRDCVRKEIKSCFK